MTKVMKMLSAFMSAVYIQVHSRLIIRVNTMNPDQTALQSDLSPYCLQNSLLKK